MNPINRNSIGHRTTRALTATFVLALGGITTGVLGFGDAFAQTSGTVSTTAAATQSRDLIASYRSIVKSLEAARASLASDPASSSAQIEAASTVFRNILDAVGSKQLEDGATRALKDAVTAVGRGSGTDLAAQVGQVESILQRVLYERLFVEMSGKNLAQAKRYASVLAEALKFSKDVQPKLLQSVAANNAARTRSLLETQISSSMAAALKQAKTSPDKAVSFRQTANASSAKRAISNSWASFESLTCGRDFVAMTVRRAGTGLRAVAGAGWLGVDGTLEGKILGGFVLNPSAAGSGLLGSAGNGAALLCSPASSSKARRKAASSSSARRSSSAGLISLPASGSRLATTGSDGWASGACRLRS